MPKKDRLGFLIVVLILLYSFVFSYFSILRHRNYYSYRYDLGNMEQTIWNTTQGNTFIFTDPEGFGNISRLKYHADFLLILIAPIYKIFPYTETLLILQTIGLALGAIPIYWLGKEILKNKKLAILPVIFYLLYPVLQRSNYFDFHAVKFATTFLLFAFWFLYKKNFFWFVLFSILAILCKEQIPLIIMILSFYGALKDKKNKMKWVIFGIVCLIYFWLIVFKIIPQFRETNQHFIFKHFTNQETSGEDIKLDLNLGILTDSKVWLMFVRLFLPLGFIPMLSPGYLILTFPDLIPRILSTNIYYRSIDFQYNNPVIPFIFIAFIFGLNRCLILLANQKIIFRKIALLVLILILFTSVYLWSPFSGSFAGIKADKILSKRAEKQFIDDFKKKIPDGKSLCVTNNLGSHFARRLFLYSFPNNALEADYTLILKGDGNMINIKTTKDILKALEKSSHYLKIAEYKDFVAFKRI